MKDSAVRGATVEERRDVVSRSLANDSLAMPGDRLDRQLACASGPARSVAVRSQPEILALVPLSRRVGTAHSTEPPDHRAALLGDISARILDTVRSREILFALENSARITRDVSYGAGARTLGPGFRQRNRAGSAYGAFFAGSASVASRPYHPRR